MAAIGGGWQHFDSWRPSSIRAISSVRLSPKTLQQRVARIQARLGAPRFELTAFQA